MDKYENFIQTVNWSVREEPAVKIFSVDLSQEIVDEVNEYIDNNTIPNNINYAANLAGQLKENEKSAQLDFDCIRWQLHTYRKRIVVYLKQWFLICGLIMHMLEIIIQYTIMV